MTDKTHPEAGSTHIIRYALELGLLWIDGSGRDKVREALDALDALEAKLAFIGAARAPALSAAPAEQQATKETSGGFHVWRDISTAPKDGSRFVATGHNYGLYSEVRHTCVAQWFRGCWMEASDWNETSELKYLTHWMPLPSPPDDVAAPAPQQAAPKAAPESFLDGADVQDESGVLAYYSREAVFACITAALESVAAPKAALVLPEGWTDCTIEFGNDGPEVVAYGPKRMMTRLAKWLGKYFAQVIADAAPKAAPGVPVAWRISCPNEPDLGFWLAEEDGGEGFLSEPLYTRTAPQAAGQDARPCHVFTVRKAGGLTEWEPTTMALALPDGAHALYTLPQPSPHAQADSVTAPAVASEPIAYLYDDGSWTPAKTEEGHKLNNWMISAGSPKIGVHLASAAPLTTLAQATQVGNQQEAREPVSPRHPVVMQWRDNAIEACAKIADAYGHEHAAQDMRAMLTAPQQEAQEPCQTCTAMARTVMMDQVSFDRKPDCYGIRQITDDEGVEEWEDIRTSTDVAREEANDMMATGRGEIYEVVPLWTTPQHAPQPAPAPLSDDAKDAARWRWLSEHIDAAWNEGKFTSLVRIVSDKNRAALNASIDRMMTGDWSDAALAAQGGKV